MAKIAYIYSDELREECDRLPTILGRASIVHDLINAYKLLHDQKQSNLFVVKSLEATENELKIFHSSDYIDFLQNLDKNEDVFNQNNEENEDYYGLGYDCPVLESIFHLTKTLAGGSLTAAKLLAAKKCSVAINWFGGWHHAQRDSASGFCYVNDIVLAIHKLLESFSKILYIDLDIHHGDGVENAFIFSKRVLTFSLHKFSPGFYPGSGALHSKGLAKGAYYSLNVPLKEGLSSVTFSRVFDGVFPKIFNAFKPAAIVVQCGADGLNGDRIGGCNLTLECFTKCAKIILEKQLPTLFLGGGGYNAANSARLWTSLTSVILKRQLDNDIPETSEFFTHYGPSFELEIDEGNQKDHNSPEYIDYLIETIHEYCEFIQ